MTRLASALPLLALVSAAPLAAPLHAQAARDFQLPPAPAATESRVQGPVDTDAPVPVRPRAIETARPATPTPTPAPTAAPTSSAAPTIVLPATAPGRPASAQATSARTVPAQAAPTDGPTVASTLAPPLASPSAITPQPLPLQTAAASASPAPSPAEQPAQSLPWPWLALGGAALVAGAAFLAWRRRQAAPATPEIVVPHVPTPAAAPLPGEALAIGVEAVRMDRSVLNATVGYRVTIRNRTTQALSGVAVEADLVSASRDRPAEQQIASPEQALTPRHAAERLAPGQSLRFEGQVRLPLSEASAIWQGRAALLVPLLRVRATAAGAAPVATTLVIGRSEGSTARPQPFRLDEPPRSYAPLAQRVLDPIAQRALEKMPARA